VSILTKIFVVALVVLSLLLSAATITFVNSIDDYKRTGEASKLALATAQARASSDAAKAQADLTAKEARAKAAEDAVAARDKEVADLNQKLADLGAQLASARSDKTASEAQKSGLLEQVADLRTSNERLVNQNGELNGAFAEASNKLLVTEEARRNLAEQLTELRGSFDKVSGALRDRGVDPTRIGSSGLTAGAPPINGYISDTRSIAGIPHATISVGSEDAVKIGMEFNILDRASGQFLGKLKVVAVEPSQAVGQISGPGAQQVAKGAEVRTQL
jgi:ribosomal protein L29